MGSNLLPPVLWVAGGSASTLPAAGAVSVASVVLATPVPALSSAATSTTAGARSDDARDVGAAATALTVRAAVAVIGSGVTLPP